MEYSRRIKGNSPIMTGKTTIFVYQIVGVRPNGFKTYCSPNGRIVGYSESYVQSHTMRSFGFFLMHIPTKLKAVYYNLLQRCFNQKNPGYRNYGGRGITVCNEWRNDINSFIKWSLNNGYADGLQIDRINNNGNYEPNNCRYVIPKVNLNNRRTNVRLNLAGDIKTIAEWESDTNITRSSIKHRLSNGWEVEKALTIPTRNTERILFYKGESNSVTSWAKKYNMSPVTLCGRLNRMTLEQALETPLKAFRKKYLYNGQLLTVKQISEMCGVSADTLYDRLAKGHSIDKSTININFKFINK